MKITKILIVLLIALLMVCGLFLIGCEEIDCVGDGKCYVDRSNKRSRCSDSSCVSNKTVYFTNNENRKNCNCYK